MTVIDEVLAANRTRPERALPEGSHPSRHLIVITCMDTRINLYEAFGLQAGEAHILRNAGGRVTDDTLRSLAVSSHALGVTSAIVMQHTKCGMLGTSNEEFQSLTGAQLDFHPIDDQSANLKADVEVLASTPYLSLIEEIAGLVYDVDTGGIEELVRWHRG